jgi:hypothetical protein
MILMRLWLLLIMPPCSASALLQIMIMLLFRWVLLLLLVVLLFKLLLQLLQLMYLLQQGSFLFIPGVNILFIYTGSCSGHTSLASAHAMLLLRGPSTPIPLCCRRRWALLDACCCHDALQGWVC